MNGESRRADRSQGQPGRAGLHPALGHSRRGPLCFLHTGPGPAALGSLTSCPPFLPSRHICFAGGPGRGGGRGASLRGIQAVGCTPGPHAHRVRPQPPSQRLAREAGDAPSPDPAGRSAHPREPSAASCGTYMPPTPGGRVRAGARRGVFVLSPVRVSQKRGRLPRPPPGAQTCRKAALRCEVLRGYGFTHGR